MQSTPATATLPLISNLLPLPPDGAILAASTSIGAPISRHDLTSGRLAWQGTIPAARLGGIDALAIGNGSVYAGYGDHPPDVVDTGGARPAAHGGGDVGPQRITR